MAPEELFSWLSAGLGNLCLIVKTYTFCLFLYYCTVYFHVWIWIRIYKAPEYGSNTDPDPKHCEEFFHVFFARSL